MPLGDLITGQYQVQWRDTLIGGAGINLAIVNVTGWLDLPNMRTNPQDRPGRHGQFLGDLKASSRQITIDFEDLDDDPTGFRELTAITTVGEDQGEEPLVIYIDDVPQLVYARCEKRAIPTDQQWSVGYRRASLFFNATDPRRYGMTESSPNAGLPVLGSGGLVFPLVFPLVFGAGKGASSLAAVNNGNVPVWPVLTLTGPMTGPIVTNTDTGQALIFDPAFSLAAGQQLVIDTDARSVEFATGQDRRSALFTANWFPINPGGNHLSLNSVGAYDPSALLTVGWRTGGLRDGFL